MFSNGSWPSKDGDCVLPLPAFLTGTDGRIETHQIGDHRGLPPLEEATKRGIQICSYVNKYIYIYRDVSENSGTPKSSILIGFSIINHPFWGTPILGNSHIYIYTY